MSTEMRYADMKDTIAEVMNITNKCEGSNHRNNRISVRRFIVTFWIVWSYLESIKDGRSPKT